jgi:type III pantothenate kinase
MTNSLLAIDIGNTNTVIGRYQGDELVDLWRTTTEARATADECFIVYQSLIADLEDIKEVVVCSTVPTLLAAMREMLIKYFSNARALIVEPGIKTGVQISVDNPKEVGSDRIVNTLAVFTRHGGPSVVVDFGTSTNFDVVSEKGEFLGGALAPGIEISLDALAARAAQLRKVELTPPRSVVGRNTVEALQSGVIYGFAGQVDGIVKRIEDQLGPLKAVVATGGLAPAVIDACTTITHHEPDLTLEGLRLIYQKNATEGDV